MAAPRLPFLWPMLFRATEMTAVRSRPLVRQRALHVSAKRRQDTVSQRYGTANEPLPHFTGEQASQPPVKSTKAPSKETKPKVEERLRQDKAVDSVAESAESTTANVDKDAAKYSPTVTDHSTAQLISDSKLDALEAAPKSTPPKALKTPAEKPLESLLDSVPDPSKISKDAKDGAKKQTEGASAAITHDEHQPPVHAPHIDAPRYVHHFDTHGLVKRLTDSGWEGEQAITVMKGMRLLLADNMHLAKEALVSKSQVENETYLFKAACSELKTEVTTRRRAEQEKMRTQRTHLQHEVDILNQRLGQESAGLKDELKGMFDDRRMAVRNEQRDMERKLQELNYKITVSLQADSKSEVEGLRWVMTRRVIITLGLIVMMIVGSIKLFSNVLHERELEEKRRARQKTAGTKTEMVSTGVDADSSRRSVGDGEMLVKEGDNPAFVSLG